MQGGSRGGEGDVRVDVGNCKLQIDNYQLSICNLQLPIGPPPLHRLFLLLLLLLLRLCRAYNPGACTAFKYHCTNRSTLYSLYGEYGPGR